MGKKLPPETRERIEQMLREVALMKVEMRAHWLGIDGERTTH